MHHIQCRCTRALVASCSRTFRHQQTRAAAPFPSRASSSSSSSSSPSLPSSSSSSSSPLSISPPGTSASEDSSVRSLPRHIGGHESSFSEGKRPRVDINNILENDFSFFTRMAAPPKRKQPKKAKIVDLCDEAIILSRTSSDPHTFLQVQELLQRAARIFHDKLGNLKSQPERIPNIAYDVYLIRSSWLQVVRTILALVGKEAAEVCSSMMCDYLRWESMLVYKNLNLKDGTEQLPSPQARKGGSEKMQEELFFHGPFVQDSAVVLYDLFWHLTISDKDVGTRPYYSKDRRTYLDEGGPRRSVVALSLWQRIIGIPVTSWKKPMSVSWRRYPYNSMRRASPPAQRLLAYAMNFQGQALLRSERLMDCIDLWKSGLGLCANGDEGQARLLMKKIITCLQHTQQYLRYGDISVRFAVGAKEYFSSLYSLLNLLIKVQWPKEPANFRIHDTLMQALLAIGKTQSMMNQRGMDSEEAAEVDYLVKRIDNVLQSYMVSWNNEPTKWFRPPPPFKFVNICNSVLFRLVVGSRHERPAPDSALRFLRLMTDRRCNLPAPDRTTSTTLLRAAQKVANVEVASAVMQALRGGVVQAAKELQEQAKTVQALDEENAPISTQPPPPSSLKSPFMLLLHDALRNADADRIVSLLTGPQGGNNAQRKHFRAVLSPSMDASPHQIVFFLYPSLDLLGRSRRGRGGALKDPSQAGRTADMNKAAFDPRVLVTLLQRIVELGKTGLAERLWRLIKRASKPKTIQSQSPGWPIPIRAYTFMMILYAMEVRKGRVHSDRLGTFRQSGMLRKRGGADVHGWGRVRFGPLRSRFKYDARLGREHTARFIVKQEYQELKERWKAGTAEPANDRFWAVLQRVFHRKGRITGRLQCDNPTDATFYNGIVEDMAKASSSLPSSPPS